MHTVASGNGHRRSPERLATLASETAAYRRLRRLIEYVGDGRRLTDKGNLALADGKALVEILETGDVFDRRIGDRVFYTKSTVELTGVDLLFRVALKAGFVRRYKGRVVRTRKAEVIEEPVEALYRAWCALLEVGPAGHRMGDDTYGLGWYTAEVDLVLPYLLREIHDLGGAPIPAVADGMWSHLLEVFDLRNVPPERLEGHRESVEFELRAAFDVLEDFGVLATRDVVNRTTSYGFQQRSGRASPSSQNWAMLCCIASPRRTGWPERCRCGALRS